MFYFSVKKITKSGISRLCTSNFRRNCQIPHLLLKSKVRQFQAIQHSLEEIPEITGTNGEFPPLFFTERRNLFQEKKRKRKKQYTAFIKEG